MAAQEGLHHADSHVQQKQLDVVIVGGSIAGLMAGVLLKRRGHNVRIIEQAETSQREGLAAGIGLTQHVRRFFDTEDRLETLLGLPNDDLLVVNDQLETRYKIPIGMRMTTWDTAYYRLRANFDGYTSTYCPSPPADKHDGSEGEANYETGTKVIKVEDFNNHMVVSTESVIDSTTEQYTCDIVIAADGANSNIRRLLNPSLQREEPGYVIWRGTVPTKDLSQEFLDKVETKAIVWQGKYNYCMLYTIPGPNGSLLPGERYINFVWYFWPTTPSISEIMTDTLSHKHRTTVPRGLLRPEIWTAQLAQAQKILPPPLADLVSKIREPFVSIVSSVASPRATYFNNKLFFIGDALTQTQPNMGQGTNLAAMAAMSLVGEVLGNGVFGEGEVRKWEGKVLLETEVVRVRSAAFASWFMCGWGGMGWYYARSWWVLVRQRVLGW